MYYQHQTGADSGFPLLDVGDILVGMRTGRADLPLHSGKAPAWLFGRMKLLAREMSIAIVQEEGPHGLLDRLSDPFWFQAFGCVLGFDWHSSGVTTTVCGALKEGLRDAFDDTGVIVTGGKGKTSRRAPDEIATGSARLGLDPEPLIRASKLSAKVDSAAVQDGFQVYQHTFLFTADGSWSVIQQGMNDQTGWARRYHWLDAPTFVSDPHQAVAGEAKGAVLNLVANEADGNRAVAVELAREEPKKVTNEIRKMKTLEMPRHHMLQVADLHPDRLDRILVNAYESQPADYTDLLATRGVGAKGLRALSLVAELTYGAKTSARDPASFSFAHGGKDGTPFPVDRETYDITIESLRRVVQEAKAGRTEKQSALKRLARLQPSG